MSRGYKPVSIPPDPAMYLPDDLTTIAKQVGPLPANLTFESTPREFHADARCGACGGPLDTSRDAICEKCAPNDF